MRNPSTRGAALALLLLTIAPVDAQTEILPLPPPPSSLAPTGTVQRALGTAFTAITGALATNPAGARQANLLYQQALARYGDGDLDNAYAEANAARSIAESPAGPTASSTPAQPQLQSGAVAPSRAPAKLPDELLTAYLEIDTAADFGGPQLEAAKRH
ncbi:MAG: hypothetical protein ACLPYS_03420 [Vulcanimicrobiaceae bacterium]